MSDPALQPEILRRGPRPGTLSVLQKSQRATSRDNILRATRELLVDKAFDALSIEEVLARAPVSRATFYRHFRSKYDVALALYEETFSSALGHFEQLVALDENEARAAAWIETLVAIYRASGPVSYLILQLGVSDRLFHERLQHDRYWMIDHLAHHIPAFARAHGSSPAALRQRARADLLLLLLDRVCVEIAVHEGLPHHRYYVEHVAKELVAFLGAG